MYNREVFLICCCFLVTTTADLTVSPPSSGEANTAANDTNQDLYVVRGLVYEVGILTEVDDNETSTSLESQERVDLTFYDTHSNKSHIDLGTVPLPVETNVSGQVFTGIAPVNLGSFSNPSEVLQTLPLTGAIANITQSDTGVFALKTGDNVAASEKDMNITGDDLKKLSEKVNN